MYVQDLIFNDSKHYICSSPIGNFLIKNGIPLLSRDGNNMIFSKTKRLQKTLGTMPFYLRVLVKVGALNG